MGKGGEGGDSPPLRVDPYIITYKPFFTVSPLAPPKKPLLAHVCRCPRVESFAMSTGLDRLLVDVPVPSPDPDVSGVRKLMERQGP